MNVGDTIFNVEAYNATGRQKGKSLVKLFIPFSLRRTRFNKCFGHAFSYNAKSVLISLFKGDKLARDRVGKNVRC